MLDRSKSMVEKYYSLAAKMQDYGIDFILPLGRSAQNIARDKYKRILNKTQTKKWVA